MKIKRLSLEYYMPLVEEYPWEIVASGLKIVPCVVYKEGWYLKGNESWWEYRGKAYTSNNLATSFKWSLTHLSATRFSNKEVELLNEVCKFLPNPIKKEIQKKLIIWEHNNEIKKIVLQGRLSSLRFKKIKPFLITKKGHKNV
jgi:hypothetical protein